MTSYTTSTTNYPQGANTAIRRVKTTRDPLTSDRKNFILGDEWLNTNSNEWWKLAGDPLSGAIWVSIGGGINLDLQTITGNSGGPVPGNASQNINLLGAAGQIAITGNPGTNTLTASLVGSAGGAIQTITTPDATVVVPTAGNVGFVNGAGIAITGAGSNVTFALSGGSTAIDSITVDNFTPPGTNPVVPDVAGLIRMTAAQVGNGGFGNVIRIQSLAANEITSVIQQAGSVVVKDITKNGVAHFNTNDFTNDEGFISTIPDTTAIRSVNLVTITVNGTYTPPANLAYAMVEVIGGGGGGGGSAGNASPQTAGSAGGGSGGYSRSIYPRATLAPSQAVTIGTGGTGGTGSVSGNSGSTTLFGALMQAGGGGGGAFGSPSAGLTNATSGQGGTSAGGQLNMAGTNGDDGFGVVIAPDSFGEGGNGGSSYFGGGGEGYTGSSAGPGGQNGDGGRSYGAGGGGAITINNGGTFTGGSGLGGLVLITEFLT